jgi:hypothetical protein
MLLFGCAEPFRKAAENLGHRCGECGVIHDRDIAASQVIFRDATVVLEKTVPVAVAGHLTRVWKRGCRGTDQVMRLRQSRFQSRLGIRHSASMAGIDVRRFFCDDGLDQPGSCACLPPGTGAGCA